MFSGCGKGRITSFLAVLFKRVVLNSFFAVLEELERRLQARIISQAGTNRFDIVPLLHERFVLLVLYHQLSRFFRCVFY